MRVAVTGANGFLGSRLIETLGERAIPLTRASHGDISDATPAWFKGVDAVVHAAAAIPQTSPPDDVWVSNVAGTAAVSAAAVHGGVKHFVFVSSAAVYGTLRTAPVCEDDPPAPVSPYGWAKLAGETVAQAHGRRTSVTVARVFNLYGPGSFSIVDKALRAHRSGQVPDIVGSKSAVRDFVHVEDAARAIVALMGRAGIWNVGTGVGRNVLEVLERICGSRQSSGPIEPGRVDVSIAGTSKLRAARVAIPDRLPEYIQQNTTQSDSGAAEQTW